MISANIKLILLVTGLVTASMVAAFFAPAVILNQLFAQPPTDAASLAVTRHWGLLVFCFGGLLVYAAYHPEVRTPVLVFAIIEKIALVVGILVLPLELRSGAYVVALSDATFTALYVLFLLGF